MNLLDLVPQFQRQVNQYIREQDTDSQLAGYISDAIEALMFFWDRTYAVTFTPPMTYNVSPDIEAKDKRPIILMASLIYKTSNTSLASWTDGDFSFQLQRGADNFLTLDITELKWYINTQLKLAKAVSAPMRGFDNIFNLESYSWYPAVELLRYHL